MPRASRLLVRTALAWLVIWVTLGVLRILPLPAPVSDWLSAAGPATLHALTVGWLTQLAMGVAHWMFPRPPAPRPTAERRLLAAHALLNGGLVLRFVAEPPVLVGRSGPWSLALAASGLLLLGAVSLFVLEAWPRARERS